MLAQAAAQLAQGGPPGSGLQLENQQLAQQLQAQRAELARLTQYLQQYRMMQSASALYGNPWVRARFHLLYSYSRSVACMRSIAVEQPLLYKYMRGVARAGRHEHAPEGGGDGCPRRIRRARAIRAGRTRQRGCPS